MTYNSEVVPICCSVRFNNYRSS